ncbi:MAG: response regulator [Bdellovibrionales bacterium]|nr:response regulator [Bdellovibrionales bacterium]
MKALILEDNLSLAESLKKLLSEQGWSVQINSSWSSVSSLVINNNFQLIVLDILLTDVKGVEVINTLLEKNVKSKVAIISGFFNENTILKNIPEIAKKNYGFFKKPFDEKKILKFTSPHTSSSKTTKPNPWSFFLEKGIPQNPLNFYFPESDNFESHLLIPLIFLAHLKSFTGDIVLEINSQENYIHFYKGKIIQVVSRSNSSFLGTLLIEHGLSLTEDIQSVLKDKTDNKKIGERLLEKKLLSPHMLDFILKEQVKIRLSEFMSHPSFKLKILSKNSENYDKIEFDFNKPEFIDWLADSVQTEIKDDFWKYFYSKFKSYQINKLTQLNTFSLNQRNFLNQYNTFFKSCENHQTLSQLTKKHQEEIIPFIYFGLLTKSFFLKESETNNETMLLFIDEISSKSNQELASLLTGNIAVVSKKEIKQKYKEMSSQIFHYTQSKEITSETKKKLDHIQEKLTSIYQNLLKNKNYTNQNLIEIMDQYKKGIDLIEEEKYEQSFQILSQIKDHKQTPKNIQLYLFWAQLKGNFLDSLGKDKKTALIKMNKEINKVPLHLRASYLYWFVVGLFYLKCKKYEKAEDFFKKTILIQSDFPQAKKELLKVKQKRKEEQKTKKTSFFSFLKKTS